MPNKNRIRRLPPGALLPHEEPRVYTTGDGYRVWRWRVAAHTYVEVLEHRVNGDRVTTAEHVHHIDHHRSNNDRDNLRPISHTEHARLHHQPKIDYEAAWERYQQGYGTIAVGREFGVNPATLSRRWRSMGYQLRSIGSGQKVVNRRGIDLERLAALHLAGMRAGPIAAELGTTKGRVYSIIRDLGLPSHRPGRPTL